MQLLEGLLDLRATYDDLEPVTSAGVVFKPVSARSCFGLYAVMAVMVTSSSVGFWFVILVRRLLARMSRPR